MSANARLDEQRVERQGPRAGKADRDLLRASGLLAAVQPDEPFGVAARAGTRDFLYGQLSRASRSAGCAGCEWLAVLSPRDFESVAAHESGKAGTALPEGTSNQSFVAGACGGRGHRVSGGD